MKVGRTGLRMSSGEIRDFKSPEARARFERFAQGIKHGWKPRYKKRRGKPKSKLERILRS